jgi:hypothetical protein
VTTHLDTDVLVYPNWLHTYLRDPNARVVEVDVSSQRYEDWHIDDAVLWHIYTDLKDADYRLGDHESLMTLFSRSGISSDTTVVFYGYAPAMGVWLLKACGHCDARILDCSRETWRRDGHPWSTTTPEASPGTYVVSSLNTGVRAERADVELAIARRGTTLVDVRSEPEYRATVLALWRHGTRRPRRPHSRRGPSADRRPAPRRRLVPTSEGAAQRLRERRARQQRRADHVLHDRRPRCDRRVRPHRPAWPRPRPCLRRIVGRTGPTPRHPIAS